MNESIKALSNKTLQRTFEIKLCLRNKRVICLDIPDEYEYMDQELVALLEERVKRFIRDA